MREVIKVLEKWAYKTELEGYEKEITKEIEGLKYSLANIVLEEFLRKVDWFMWDKKTMQNISNWINKQEKI